MTKEEILKQEGYREYDAMDEYAKQVSIDFIKWKWDSVDRDSGYDEDKRFVLYSGESLTPEELFAEFLKQYNK